MTGVLKRRAHELSASIQMCDAQSRNIPKGRNPDRELSGAWNHCHPAEACPTASAKAFTEGRLARQQRHLLHLHAPVRTFAIAPRAFQLAVAALSAHLQLQNLPIDVLATDPITRPLKDAGEILSLGNR
jgi:hypothetical protein